MITMDRLIAEIDPLTIEDIEGWIVKEWVRPDGHPGGYRFHPIDVARIRLIQQLRVDMQVNDEALPIILSLLDQLYDHRRRLRDLSEALARTAPAPVRRSIARHLMSARSSVDLRL